MGVSIYWRPVSTGHNVTPGARSAFWEALKDTFGDFPITMGSGHVPMLRAMAAAATDSDTKRSYLKLVTALEQVDEIEVYDTW